MKIEAVYEKEKLKFIFGILVFLLVLCFCQVSNAFYDDTEVNVGEKIWVNSEYGSAWFEIPCPEFELMIVTVSISNVL